MCRSISLLITRYLAIPLNEVVVPGYTPAGDGKPCASVVYLPAHRQGPGYP